MTPRNVRAYLALSEREAAKDAEIVRKDEALARARECIMAANHETGYCCCGSSVEGHGIGSGHSPVDEGSYFMQGTIELIEAALTKGQVDAG